MHKFVAFKAPCVAYGIRIRSILRGLEFLWSWGSLGKGRGRIWGLGYRIRTPLEGLVLGKGLRILRFRGMSSFLLLLNLVSKNVNQIQGSVSW